MIGNYVSAIMLLLLVWYLPHVVHLLSAERIREKIASYLSIWCSALSSNLWINKTLRSCFFSGVHGGCSIKYKAVRFPPLLVQTHAHFLTIHLASPWRGHPPLRTSQEMRKSLTLQVLLLLSTVLCVLCVGREKREFITWILSHLWRLRG